MRSNTNHTCAHTQQQSIWTCFSSLLSTYMEAISPLPLRLLRIGGHFILPVLIRMSAGSVTCNLSTKPQQLHRDGEHSHNDIILDWGRVLGGVTDDVDFPPLCLPPSFSSRSSETRPMQLSPGCFTLWALWLRSVCFVSRVYLSKDNFSYTLPVQPVLLLNVEHLNNSLMGISHKFLSLGQIYNVESFKWNCFLCPWQLNAFNMRFREF